MARQRYAGYEVARDAGLLVPDAQITLATSLAADDILDTATAHGFTAGKSVVFDTLTGGAGLAVATRYWVIAANLTTTTFQIALTAGGAAIDFTTDITAGTVRKDGPDIRVALAMSGFTAAPVITLALSAAADDIIDTTVAHGFVADDVVELPTLTGGAGLVILTHYWVIAANLAAQTFQVSATKGGAAIDFTTDITAGTVRGMAGAAVNLADVTLDEFDGANYVRYDALGVAVAYDADSDEKRWTCTNGAGNEFGTSVGAGATGPPTTLVVILNVDGTAANDYILASSDEGGYADGNNGNMGLTLPNDVIIFSADAA